MKPDHTPIRQWAKCVSIIRTLAEKPSHTSDGEQCTREAANRCADNQNR